MKVKVILLVFPASTLGEEVLEVLEEVVGDEVVMIEVLALTRGSLSSHLRVAEDEGSILDTDTVSRVWNSEERKNNY